MTNAKIGFLLGAGFKADAKAEADRIAAADPKKDPPPTDCSYPLVSQLWGICFPGEEVDRRLGIEEVLAQKLAKTLTSKARLCECAWSRPP